MGGNVGMKEVESETELGGTAGGVLEGVLYWFGEFEGERFSLFKVTWEIEVGLCWLLREMGFIIAFEDEGRV